ncbi:MAG: hypothetical protein AB1486_06020 [Planctomycetota bacterium]
MSGELIVDLKKLDLSRVLYGKEAIREVCPQRGRLEMLDGILHYDEGQGVIVGFKDIHADDWWVPDHIPGRPIFPGVLMIECCAQLCSFDFIKRNPHIDHTKFFIGYGGLDKVRFRAAVPPGRRFIMVGKVRRIRSRTFTYLAQGFVGETLAFETQIVGVAM